MKSQINTVLWLLFLCIHPLLIAQTTDYDPNNPPEPENLFELKLESNTTQGASAYGEGFYPEGKSVWVYAYVWGGNQFLGWMWGDSLLTTSNGFHFVMPARPVTLKAMYKYNPGNPAEPELRFTLKLYNHPENAGYLYNDNLFQTPGTNYNVQANPYYGYSFKAWYRKDSLVSTDRVYNHTTGYKNDTLYAYYEYTPEIPSEPNTGTSSKYNLSLLNLYSEAGRTIAVPVHLFNQNFEVSGASFVMTFPVGVNVDTQGALLSARKNGHNLWIENLNNNQYFISISETNNTTFSGSSGVILTIPVVLSDTLKAGQHYAINLSDVLVKGPQGNVNCPFKNGGVIIKSTEAALYASFYPDIFLNRAKFINLSSPSAEEYLWNFGDGTESVEKEPLHTYLQGGSYAVKLKVKSGVLTDSASFTILINPQSQWKIGGYFSLNPAVQDVKNFENLVSMFELFDKASISSSLFVDVNGDFNYDLHMLDTLPAVIERTAVEINLKGLKLSFNSLNPQASPKLNFVDGIDQLKLNVLRNLWKNTIVSNVEFCLENTPIKINMLNQLERQFVCSGSESDTIDFKSINPTIAYQWSLKKAPSHSSGYLNSGDNLILPMQLLNNDLYNDTLVYNVDAAIPNVDISTLLTHQIIVKPLLTKTPYLTSPLPNSVLESPTVNFIWESIPNTLFDLYVWELGVIRPQTPTFSNIEGNSFTNNGVCKYSKSYQWMVKARGECNEIYSDSSIFSIRILPDLQVLEIVYPDTMFAGDNIKVKAKIKNSFGKAPITWWRDELSLSKTEQLEGIVYLQAVNTWRTVEVDSTYVVEFNATLPLDTIKYSYFIVKTDVYNNLLESNETNNITLSTPINIQKPVVENEDFELLKRIYGQNQGSLWKRKWKINSNVLIASNWPGVEFKRGKVFGINLQDNNAGGLLSQNFFGFSKLEYLNLGYNNFEGRVDTLQGSESLKELNLQHNRLKGELSSLANKLPLLEKLNVSSNGFSLDSALSANIKELNLNYQKYYIDSANMRAEMNFDTLPNISRYNHYRRDFKDMPGFYIYHQNNWVGALSHWNDSYHLSWDNYQGWRIDSGADLELRQSGGYSYGSISPFKMFFEKGDNNVDGSIDLLDIQHGLNFLLLKYPALFNYNAGNTFPDDQFTVQDIVTTVNLVLAQQNPAPNANVELQKLPGTYSEIYIQNGKLMLKITDETAAFDFTLSNCKSSDFELSSEFNEFAVGMKELENSFRCIMYSLNDDSKIQGIYELGTVKSQGAAIKRADLCNLNNERIPVRISELPTNLLSNTMKFTAMIWNGKLQVLNSIDRGNCSLRLINLQGELINYQETALPAGIHTFDWMDKLSEGIYLLEIKSKDGNVQFKLIKP